ncbi:MAG: 16S rRNA (guanine(527)-N(7))-methyltransferase RsmG [Bacteroidetes bacterium CG2_30_33_31]|nr:MAG: 16S rRNA (guanine(527)-N(7))-methyltransferase RsmG [Bacteroidetes bacterium CG2_30_33_31]
MDNIRKYFPLLSSEQLDRFERLMPLYEDWNSKINVISRKDFLHFYQRHVLHSMAIAKVVEFKNGTEILDLGTGGGFPGIPLAIMFPQVQFTLIDGIAKKIKVVNDAVEKLELKNINAQQMRVENLNASFDFIVSRAVTDLPMFYHWSKNKIKKKNFNYIRNGVLYLKGGDLAEDVIFFGKKARLYPIKNYFDEEFFESKFVIHF